MISDHEILQALSDLFADLGGDAGEMPLDRDGIYRAFEDLGAPPDVLALIGGWRLMLTNREMLPLIELRRRTAFR